MERKEKNAVVGDDAGGGCDGPDMFLLSLGRFGVGMRVQGRVRWSPSTCTSRQLQAGQKNGEDVVLFKHSRSETSLMPPPLMRKTYITFGHVEFPIFRSFCILGTHGSVERPL